VHSIIHIDGGESGRSETRHSVVNRQTYGIAMTRIDYLRHAFVEDGPFGIARHTTEYFYFCDGKPYVPGENGAVVDCQLGFWRGPARFGALWRTRQIGAALSPKTLNDLAASIFEIIFHS
jgi:hypothetical protein